MMTAILPEMPENLYPTISDLEMNIEGVVQLLNTIDPSKATGPDGFVKRTISRTSSLSNPKLLFIKVLSL